MNSDHFNPIETDYHIQIIVVGCFIFLVLRFISGLKLPDKVIHLYSAYWINNICFSDINKIESIPFYKFKLNRNKPNQTKRNKTIWDKNHFRTKFNTIQPSSPSDLIQFTMSDNIVYNWLKFQMIGSIVDIVGLRLFQISHQIGL